MPECPHDNPQLAVKHDLGADVPLRKDLPNALSQRLGRRCFFAKAIAEEAAECSFSASMSNGRVRALGVRRPDDVETGTQRDIPNDNLRLLPNHQAANPQFRATSSRLRFQREAGAFEQLRRHVLSPSPGLQPEVWQSAFQCPTLPAPS